MIFFRKMTASEKRTAAKGYQTGFLIYLLLTFANYFYFLLTDQALLSPGILFWAGLLGAFGYEAILNFKQRRRKAAGTSDK
ncbi:hypothetical protein [Sporosarcina trichiuri]|uniref:hypothetical protein n=1 Tax=Sporosarcina trichiuri TaxID=3056445 RepID=UPI0025B28C9A|nr:hypothetical protein [Sporosarcina sp. 0.2-SM1T-5]WJY27314.1 hypothetical protein QWT68_14930 [Sporosarcina sp. 0.2-SM1T-5]